MIQSVVESVMGCELRDAKIELAYPKPRYQPIYCDYVQSPVCFSRQCSVFRIPVEFARFPNASGNSEAYRLTQDLCRRLLENTPATNISTADRVKRLLLAYRHLREPGQTVESISVLLGYCDTAAFRKAFRRWYGQSPGEYRRNV